MPMLTIVEARSRERTEELAAAALEVLRVAKEVKAYGKVDARWLASRIEEVIEGKGKDGNAKLNVLPE